MDQNRVDSPIALGPIRPNRDLLSTPLDDGMVLMSVENGRYYSLDTVATAIWRQLEQEPDCEKLVATMVRDFRGNPERIRIDVHALIGRWLTEGLVSINA